MSYIPEGVYKCDLYASPTKIKDMCSAVLASHGWHASRLWVVAGGGWFLVHCMQHAGSSPFPAFAHYGRGFTGPIVLCCKAVACLGWELCCTWLQLQLTGCWESGEDRRGLVSGISHRYNSATESGYFLTSFSWLPGADRFICNSTGKNSQLKSLLIMLYLIATKKVIWSQYILLLPSSFHYFLKLLLLLFPALEITLFLTVRNRTF